MIGMSTDEMTGRNIEETITRAECVRGISQFEKGFETEGFDDAYHEVTSLIADQIQCWPSCGALQSLPSAIVRTFLFFETSCSARK
jgi:hypothetical protein